MDKNIIQTIAEYCGDPCPSLKYENPLLDKNTADLVAKGFIKIFNEESLEENQRKIILTDIRKSCKVEPPGHLYIDDTVTEIIRNAYIKLPESSNNINKDLDSFLIRYLKDINLESIYTPSFTPDIVQALVHLNNDKKELSDMLLKDIIYWNYDDSKDGAYSGMLKSMWHEENLNSMSNGQPDDISIKTKPLIERILLKNACEFLTTLIVDDDWFYEVEELKLLIMKCTVSSECFQLCCSIMNALFIKINFHEQMQRFITLFMNCIKMKVKYVSQLYPVNLQHIVMLLDIELNDLKGEIKERYIAYTLKHLNKLHEQCESDLFMLLSHFEQWFNPYYENQLEWEKKIIVY